jgi:hypothetical protein
MTDWGAIIDAAGVQPMSALPPLPRGYRLDVPIRQGGKRLLSDAEVGLPPLPPGYTLDQPQSPLLSDEDVGLSPRATQHPGARTRMDFRAMFAPDPPAPSAPPQQPDFRAMFSPEGETQQQRPIRPEDQIRALGQGALAGFGDEAEAATRASLAKAQGDKRSWQELYDSYLGNARNMIQRFQNAHPTEAALDEGMGAVGALLIPGPDILEGGTWLARVANAAAKGAAYGGVSGFGTGEGPEDRAARARFGAEIGGVAGAGGSIGLDVAAKGISQLGKPLIAAINPEAAAASRVGAAISRDQAAGSGLSDADFAAAQTGGQPVTNLERGGELTRSLMRSAANTSPQARETIEQAISGEGSRFETQGDRLTDFLANTVNGQDALGVREALLQQARTANAPAYAAAYGHPNAQALWDQNFHELTGAPALQAAIRKASTKGANQAAAEGVRQTPNPFVTDGQGNLTLRTNPDGSFAYPNLRFWDSVKQNLDDQINTLQRAGKKSAAADAIQLKNRLANLLDENVPAYQSARSSAAAYFGAQDALSAGENFVGMRGSIGDAATAWRNMSDPEKRLFKLGFVSKLVDTVSKVPDRSDVVRRIFGSNDARNRVRLALGPDDAEELEAFLGVEGLMDKARKALGNSTTARQQSELGIAGQIVGHGAVGAVGGVGYGLATGDWRDAGVAGLLTAAGKAGRIKINDRVVQAIARQLVSDDPAVYQKAIGAVAKNPTLMKLVRSAVALPTAAAVQHARAP